RLRPLVLSGLRSPVALREIHVVGVVLLVADAAPVAGVGAALVGRKLGESAGALLGMPVLVHPDTSLMDALLVPLVLLVVLVLVSLAGLVVLRVPLVGLVVLAVV